MKIKVKQGSSPFSHLPGTSLLLPGSSLSLTVYPARIEWKDLAHPDTNSSSVLSFILKEPIKEFTVLQEIEQKRIKVWGQGKEYFRYFICNHGESFFLYLDKGEGIKILQGGKVRELKVKEKFVFPSPLISFPHRSLEKISFGVTKKPDWEQVKRRLNLSEILPIWFALGQTIQEKPFLYEGTLTLLKNCHEQLKKKEKENIGATFLDLFLIGFTGIFSPNLVDKGYRGFVLPSPSFHSPLPLLVEGAKLIRRLFIEEGDEISLLPCLPPELHAGRFVGAIISPSLSMDFEWSKKRLCRVILRSNEKQKIAFTFPNEIKSFRLCKDKKGERRKAGEALVLSEKGVYVLDCFQK